ncbi:MAG TPA: MFS transporter [Candidatus Acidoferrales bacterium]|nr:MFS transporter [Candidatus Acidoferrales bacterium]
MLYSLDPVNSAKLYPRTALILLTALNLLNYVDRSVLFAVQPLVQTEFRLSNTQVGYLTSAFLLFYMVSAPFVGPLADRYSRKKIIVGGAIFWSGLTLLTAVTHTYTELLIRHTLVGIGEATFVTIAPTFVADLFPEERRGRILGVFYLAIPVGTAAGYLLGGKLSPHYGWRFPFYIAAVPGFVLALAVLFLHEPERGQFDSVKDNAVDDLLPADFSGGGLKRFFATAYSYVRKLYAALARNPAFWSSTLGMAMMTFALGGIQVWMPTFLSRARGYSLESANFMFGIIIVVDGIVASLAGGWLGDYLLPRLKGSYYFVSAASMALGVPFMIVALFTRGPAMLPAIALAAFFLLLNTSPLNAAVINSVGAHIRATALAANIFVLHFLGDVPSPTLMGYVADKKSLQAAFVLPVIAMVASSAILFYGMRFAPAGRTATPQAGKT